MKQKTAEQKQSILQSIPKIDKIFELANTDIFFKNVPKSVVVNSIRKITNRFRERLLRGNEKMTKEEISEKATLDKLKKEVGKKMTPNLRYAVNATGVVVHTNLGRSLLSRQGIAHILSVADRYSNLEFDLARGKRGSRYRAVEELLCEISGAKAAMVVNNNAGAVLLCIETLAAGKEVVVSAGELVEIGGAFRIPDIIKKSGSIIRTVGTTNRTHIKDYEENINENTALLLKVHKSNYDIIGFTKEIPLSELVILGKKHGIKVMDDLGSGTFIDFSKYNMDKEPTVTDAVASGADIVTFSGDKLLGATQAGIILGKKELIADIRKNPLTRALRIDKLTLAGLEATIRLYRDESLAIREIPTLRMLTMQFTEIEKKAEELANILGQIKTERLAIKPVGRTSRAGGGALCSQELPSICIGISVSGISASRIEKAMRLNNPPIIGTIENDLFLMDVRTINDDEFRIIENALSKILKHDGL